MLLIFNMLKVAKIRNFHEFIWHKKLEFEWTKKVKPAGIRAGCVIGVFLS